MFMPIRRLAPPAMYCRIFFAEPNLFVKTNGKPIKLLTIAIPIIEPIPKISIKLKTASTFPRVLAVKTTRAPLPARP